MNAGHESSRRMSKSDKAALSLPVARITRRMKKVSTMNRVGQRSGLVLTGLLEYMVRPCD